ncbi:MAG: hypothetical protein TR69_WS6001000149 [candidate division WS6 bacterium OLB20]|uniref:DUF3324 domain-containing protein n=1 Tax=candidate division WS6 bacterium OLB20 TaxID=1617426 RepID=A0A136M050_9BACT|nr:MAG: hypothetical protein TR69_WS6001000149 [candidate division WS6 bacterium OLB20]
MFKKSLLLTAALTALFLGGMLSQSFAQDNVVDDKGITVSPVRFEYDVDPGETVTGQLKLINSTFSDKTLYLYTLNFKSDGQSGTPLFHNEELPYSASLKEWISLSESEFIVKQVEPDNPNTKVIDFTIEVPVDAEPGGHYAGIIASLVKPGQSLDTGNNNIAFKDERAAIILLNVKGDVVRTLTVDKFYATDPFTRQKPLVNVFEWMPVGFVTELRNVGNSHTVPLGHIFIYSGDSKIAELDFNPANGSILKDSARVFVDRWTGALLELKPVLDENGNEITDENGTVQTRFAVDPSNFSLPFGQYTAKLAVGYDDAGSKKIVDAQEFTFWVIPWKLLLAIAVLLILYVGYRIRKHRAGKGKKK